MPALYVVTSPPTHSSGNVVQTSAIASRCGQRLSKCAELESTRTYLLPFPLSLSEGAGVCANNKLTSTT